MIFGTKKFQDYDQLSYLFEKFTIFTNSMLSLQGQKNFVDFFFCFFKKLSHEY